MRNNYRRWHRKRRQSEEQRGIAGKNESVVRATCIGTKRDFLLLERCLLGRLKLRQVTGALARSGFEAQGGADVIERRLIEKETSEIHLNQTSAITPWGTELASRRRVCCLYCGDNVICIYRQKIFKIHLELAAELQHIFLLTVKLQLISAASKAVEIIYWRNSYMPIKQLDKS